MSSDRLFDRAIPDDYIDEWTKRVAMPKVQKAADSKSVLIVRIAAEWFGLDSIFIDELTDIARIHRVPHRRNGIVTGIINVRGQLVICVSLSQLLQLGDHESPYRRLVVVKNEQVRLGIPVHEVFGTYRYEAHHVQEIGSPRSDGRYTSGIIEVSDKRVACLDTAALMAALRNSIT